MTTQQMFMFIVLVVFFGCEILWLLREGKKIDRRFGRPADEAPPAGE